MAETIRARPLLKGNEQHKTKRPGLDLSRGTYVDQPSPKCCSNTGYVLNSRLKMAPACRMAGTDGLSGTGRISRPLRSFDEAAAGVARTRCMIFSAGGWL
jgi:hypothetical protein